MTKIWVRLAGSVTAWALVLGVANAQTPTPQSESSTTPTDAAETRPGTTTFTGDTGLWFVPTAEVLSRGRWSSSAYRRGSNYVQGFTNVVDVVGTFAVGLGHRTEVFGSFLFDTRIERDLRPLFTSNPEVGGLLDRYPRVNTRWTGSTLGDLYVGAKVNLLSEADQKPLALAVRGVVKAPTGDFDAGSSTGKADMLLDLVATKEAARKIELTGFAGWEVRGTPAGFEAPSGAFRWGAGAGFPSRSPFRGLIEIDGTLPNQASLRQTGAPIVSGFDGSTSSLTSSVDHLTRATAGVTYQHRSGLFVGGGFSVNHPMRNRESFKTDEDAIGDFTDWQVRVGYHPGTRVYVAPPPPPPPPPPPAPPQNRPPSVQARCEPCTVEVGRPSTVTADATDPDGDALRYRWSAPTGAFQAGTDRQTPWTAPQQEGPVPVTVTVDDGRGGTASAMVTIQAVRPAPIVELNFEDVYFDFDRSSLRPEALRLLDDAIAKLQANPDKSLVIEGHTCSIGTAEYNLALGERRARSVRDYLASRGVSGNRLEVRSYGEERPKFDNAREETRRLNRRAALVVKVQ